MALQSSYRYVSAQAVRRTLRSFRDFILSQDSRYKIRNLVYERYEERRSTAIPAPLGWRLCYTPFEVIFGTNGDDNSPLPWESFLCCDNPLEVLGILRYIKPVSDTFNSSDSEDEDFEAIESNSDTETSSAPVLLMGRYETIWCFDRVDTVLFLVATSFDSLARKGLLHLDILYRHPFMPSFTESHSQMVTELIQASKSLPELRRVLSKYRWQMIPLRTPGEQTRVLQLCSSPFDIQAFWPFLCMDAESLEELFTILAEQLCCRGVVIGVIGECLPSGVFHGDYLILADEIGCVYYFSLFVSEMWKLADNLTMFFRIGLMKLYTKGRRFSTARRDAEELEVPGQCPHTMHHFWDRYSHIEYLSGSRNYQPRYRWLTRPDRFEENRTINGQFHVGEAAVGAADGSWDPRHRYDLPQEAEVKVALDNWQRYTRSGLSLPYPPKTLNYAIGIDETLETEMQRYHKTTETASSTFFDVDEDPLLPRDILLRRVARTIIQNGKSPVYPPIPKPGSYLPPWL
ncbi:protein US26 [Saimiriine betaherpesvirus 4]|uniref:Protein US26 n=1 Tax=Saimiriine betaherpesvirus 4 TaxID=1535247 RepID=G8XT45_9BETA|nr:protein US26 [Saimiriine betaherpesvirus 4]AEV80994.1 protein US26 [Saimiriine betaherpesvirus 4]